MTSSDMGKIYCRTCFDPGKNFYALTEMVFEAKSVLDLLRDIAQLQVPLDDPLPKMVCCYCADRLKSAYDFVVQAQEANKKYRQLLASDADPLENVELKDDTLLSDCLEESTIDIPISAYIADVKLEEDHSDNYNIILSHNDQEPGEGRINSDRRRPAGKERDALLVSGSLKVKTDHNLSDDSGGHTSGAENRDNTDNEDDAHQHGAITEYSSDESNYEPPKKVKKRKTTNSTRSTKKRRVGRQPPEYFDKIKKVNDRYGCIICEKTFSLRKDCGRHIASIHLRQTTFSCEYCGQEFSRKDKVRTHVKRMHSVRPVYPKGKHKERVFGDRLYGKPTKWLLVECKLCGLQFISTSALRLHLETHTNNDTLGHLEMDNEVVKHLFTNAMSLECVKESITKDIKEKQWFKYYAVLNEYYYEMSISDTEAEEIEAEGTKAPKYKCHLCEMEFAFKYEAYGHLKDSHGNDEIPFKCGLCKLEFISSKMFDQHSKIHCRNRHKVLLCSRCPAKFVWPENMRNHSCATKGEVLIDKEPMKCHICGRAYEVKTKLLKHIESHDLEKTMSKMTIRCGLCVQSFERMKHLRKHITMHSDGATGIDFKNSIYLKIFEKSKTLDLALLEQEIRNSFKTSQISRFYKAIDKDGNELDIYDSDSGSDDEGGENDSLPDCKYKCEVCSEMFGRRKQLLHHQQDMHSDVPLPFNCDDCTKQFVSNDLLQQHLHRDCWNEYRRVAQQCEYCNARFIWQSNLMKHKEIQHKHQRQSRPKRARTLKCEYCEKVFIWPKDLVRHKKTHTEGKQFACPHCDRKFQRKDNLLVHIRTHDPDVISLVVNSNKTVDRVLPHLMKPHGCKRIMCMICHSEHNRIRDLRSHLRSHQYAIDFEKRKEIEPIDSISSQLYPEDRPMCEEELAKRISSDIFTELNLERFYSITDENGYEVNLDSSETESDSDCETENDEEHNKTKVEMSKRTYKCDICPQLAFNRKYKVYEHHYNAHKWEDGHHICIHCNSRFISSFMLQLHYKEQCKNAKKRHFCRRCPLRFMWKGNLKAHVAMEHPPGIAKDSEANGRFECFLCQRTLLSQKDLARHMSSNHSADSELHYCLLCPKTFYDVGQLNEHLTGHRLNVGDFSAVESIIHSTCWPNGEKSVKCMICASEFQTMAELAQHFLPDNPQSICATQHSISNYSITNQKGYEMHLELDSETEPEETSGRTEENDTRTIGKPYICSLCNVSCERKYQMAQHQRSMHSYETLPLKCSNCIFKTVCQRLLDYHTTTQCHNMEKQHQCDLCKYKFMWQDNLDNHVAIVHHSLSPQSGSKDLESGHRHSKEINIFECMECHRRYNRRDRYKAHFKKFHSTSTVTPEKELKSTALKSKHFLCPFCGVNFSSNSNLTVHMRRHTGEKPFKCDLCEMAFPRSSDLQSHYRTHTGEKPYKCTYCDKSFSRQYKLNVHVRIHTGERPYSCTYCPKSFTQSNDLTLHVRRHTGERPYSCEVCGEGFICATSLKQHKNSKGHHTETKEEQSAQLPHFELNF